MRTDLAVVGPVAQSTVQVGKTTYRVEVEVVAGIPGQPNFETIVLTGPRGAQLLMVQYVDSENYHAFRTSGSHADLKDPATGRVARFARDGHTFTLI